MRFNTQHFSLTQRRCKSSVIGVAALLRVLRCFFGVVAWSLRPV